MKSEQLYFVWLLDSYFVLLELMFSPKRSLLSKNVEFTKEARFAVFHSVSPIHLQLKSVPHPTCRRVHITIFVSTKVFSPISRHILNPSRIPLSACVICSFVSWNFGKHLNTVFRSFHFSKGSLLCKVANLVLFALSIENNI